MGTLTAIEAKVLGRLEEDTSTPVHWGLAEVRRAINDGQDEICEASEWFEASNQIPLQPKTYYNLLHWTTHIPIRLLRVFDTKTQRWLDPTTIERLDSEYAQWESHTASVPERWFMRGPFTVGLHPKVGTSFPSDMDTNVFLNLHYKAMRRELVNASDDTDLQRRFDRAVEEFAVYDLEMQDGEIDLGLRHFENFVSMMSGLGIHYGAPDVIPRSRRMGSDNVR